MDKTSKIFVAGHRGLVGSALVRVLKLNGYHNLLLRTHSELDLLDALATENFFAVERPDVVFLAAARVGGIYANSHAPGDFIRDNLAIQISVLEAARKYCVDRLLFLGSSCIYPRNCPQPMHETHLLTGPLEPTNSPYAVAKIAGIEMCQAYNRQYGTRFLAVMPTNLYGAADNYDLQNSHVLPAMIRKFHLARLASLGDWAAIEYDERVFGSIPSEQRQALRVACMSPATAGYEVSLWGSGLPRREFLFDEDMAAACMMLMLLPSDEYVALLSRWERPLINIGCGEDRSIAELAAIVSKVVGFAGDYNFDPRMPDGAPRKLLDTSRIQQLGWRPKVSLEEGICRTYQSYLTRSQIMQPT